MNVNVEKIEKDIFIFLEKAQEELSIIQNEDLLNQSKSHFLGKENLLQLSGRSAKARQHPRVRCYSESQTHL